MHRILTAIRKQRETAWREYKQTRNVTRLETNLDALQDLEDTIRKAQDQAERTRPQAIAV